MKKDDFVRAFDAVRPDASMKQRFIRVIESRGRRRFRLDKPAQLIASLGSAAVVCAGAVAIWLVLRDGSGMGIVSPAGSVTLGITAGTPAQNVAPAATMPVGAPYTEDVKLLENVNELILERLYIETNLDMAGNGDRDSAAEIIKKFTPQDYPENIMPGLAWEMEKHVSDAGYLFDAVIGYSWPEEEYKKIYTYNGMTYDEAEKDYNNRYEELLKEMGELKTIRSPSDEDKEKMQQNYMARLELMKERPYETAFLDGYRKELAKRRDEALSEYLEFHAIPVVEPIRLENTMSAGRFSRTGSYVYSKFTRDELLYFADNGFTCSMVGTRAPLQRPEGYPDIIGDETAIALDRAPSGDMMKAYLSLYCFRGKLPAEKHAQALQDASELLSGYGIDEMSTISVAYDSDSGQKGETNIHCGFYASKDTVLALSECNDIRKISASHPETSLEFYYNSYGDGFAVLPEVNKSNSYGIISNSYRVFVWYDLPTPRAFVPEPSPTPMPTPPAGAQHTGDVSLLDNVQELILDESALAGIGGSTYQQSGEIVEQSTPQGYPANIMSGLARKMEKHVSDKDFLFDAVIGYAWPKEENGKYLASHAIPVIDIKKQDKQIRAGCSFIYSKFTRGELFYLADCGFTCHLVGKRADRNDIIGKIPASAPEASLESYYGSNGDGFAALPEGGKGVTYTEFIWYE